MVTVPPPTDPEVLPPARNEGALGLGYYIPPGFREFDGGGVGDFFDSRLNFARSYGVEPVTDINTNLTFKDAAKTVAEFTPIIGDAMAAKEIYDELTKEDPNYKLIAALGGAALIGAVPGIGDAAAAGIRKAADVARRIEVDPNALGSMGGNIRIKPSTEDLASEYLARTEKTLKLQKIDRVIADGKVDNLNADEINRNVLSVASREGIPFPKRAFNNENVQYISTKLINENLPRGNPPRYNVGEFFPIEDGVGKIAPATDLDVKKFLESEKKSLKEEIFSEGIKNPIEIKLSKKTGEAHIGDGHHRLDAALELGIEEVPIIVKVSDNELLKKFMTPIKVNTQGLEANKNYSFDKINFLQRIERPRPPLNKPGEFAYDEFDRPLSLYGDAERGGIDTIPTDFIKPMRPGMYRVRNVDKEYLSEAERELLRNSPDVPLVDKSKYADGGVVSNNEDPSRASNSQKNLANKLIDAAISAEGVRAEAKQKFIEGNYAEGIAEHLIGLGGSIPVYKQINAGIGQALREADIQGDYSFGNVLKNLLNPNNSISFVKEKLGLKEGGVVSFAPYLR